MTGPYRGLSLDWYPITPIHIAATTVGGQFITRECRLYGWAFEETTGSAPAKCDLYDGTTTGGQTIVPITLLANESTRDIWGKPGIVVGNGIFLNVLSGSVRATVYVLPLTEEEILRLNGYQVSE
jgi:hypothetical protein